MPKIVNRYNFFDSIKLTPEGYVEVVFVDYVPPQEDGVDQYQTFKLINLDEEGRLKVTVKTTGS
jgi:hypothetical protein